MAGEYKDCRMALPEVMKNGFHCQLPVVWHCWQRQWLHREFLLYLQSMHRDKLSATVTI